MSNVELHTGILRKVDIGNLTPEEWCKKWLESNKQQVLQYETPEKAFDRVTDYTYLITDSSIYEINDINHGDDYAYYMNKNEDGTYSYVMQFYNGGACLDEVLRDAIKKFE